MTIARFSIMGMQLAAVLALAVGCTGGDDAKPFPTSTIGYVVPVGDDETPSPTALPQKTPQVTPDTDRSDTAKQPPMSTTPPPPTPTPTPTPKPIGKFIVLATSPPLTPRFVVNSTVDAVDAKPGDARCDDGSGNCTLRAAIMETNALEGADAITLPAGTYRLTIAGVDEDAGRTGDIDISDDLTIRGAGADNTIIDAGGLDRAFEIVLGTASYKAWLELKTPLVSAVGPIVHISGVTIRNGNATAGGGIANRGGTLTITDSAISGNSATNGGGIFGSFWSTPSGYPAASQSRIAVYNSTVKDNLATDEGGGIYLRGALTLADSTVSGNSATNGGGLYIMWSGSPIYPHGATLYDSIVKGNSASSEGGGIWSAAPLTLFDTPVRDNSAGEGYSLDIYASLGCSQCDPGSGSIELGDTTLSDDPALAESLKEASKAYDKGDRLAALKIRLALAQEGEAEAQRLVGQTLYDGHGVEQSYEGAAYWWELAASQGEVEAQNNLGVLYHQGFGVERDYEKAAYWYNAAAGQGHQWAQINIGGLYFNGDGVPQDYVLAAYWFVTAQIGDDRDAWRVAYRWVQTSERVAKGLQTQPVDYMDFFKKAPAPADRAKLSYDDVTAAFIGLVIGLVQEALVQTDWGRNPVPLTPFEHRALVRQCLGWWSDPAHHNIYGGRLGGPNIFSNYC